MPRTRRSASALAVVQAQISRMQAALAKLQVEIARLRRMQLRNLSRASRRAPATLRAPRRVATMEAAGTFYEFIFAFQKQEERPQGARSSAG